MDSTHRRRGLCALAVTIVALGAGTAEATTPPPSFDTEIAEAVASCVGVELELVDVTSRFPLTISEDDFEILDEGHSVILDDFIYANGCLRDQLGLPEWTTELMEHTEGLVTVELENGYTLRWIGDVVLIHDVEAG